MLKNIDDRTSHLNCYLPKVEIKVCNIMIDGKNVFNQPINYDIKTYVSIIKIETGKETITQLVVC